MTEYQIVAATQAHIVELAVTMGQADRDEIWAASRSVPLQSLERAVRVSRDPQAGLANGRVICIFGVKEPTALSTTATPWLLGSEELPLHARRFLRLSRIYFADWLERYGALVNYVDVRHTAAIRWLAWLGFSFEPAKPFGVAQLPFHRFHAER